MRDMPRILLIKTSSLGDVVHNLPVVDDILAHLPNASIDWVVEESFAAIPSLHSGVANVIPVAVRRWRRELGHAQTWREISRFRQTLQTHVYDAVIDTQGLLKSAMIAIQARGCRHGQDRQSVREPLASLFYDRKHHVARGQHAVVRNRQLAAQALGYALPATLPDYGIAAHGSMPHGSMPHGSMPHGSMPHGSMPHGSMPHGSMPIDTLPAAYVVGLHATSRTAKLWPIEHWITLGRYLSTQGLGLLLPWHSTAEHERAQLIAAQVDTAAVLPRLTLDSIAIVLAQARAAVGVDTGLTHLAVALGIPTLALYTDTEPALTGVYAGATAPAVNLGGLGRTPVPDEAILALRQLLSLPA